MARVLVVDDDAALLRALRVGLSAVGHQVLAASNGEEGLEIAARTSPEVIVLDLGLPDIDGLAVCRRIRGWSQVPIVVLSAIGAEDRKVAALDGGADDYVTKPFGMAELEARIRTAVRKRNVGAESRAGPVVTVGPLIIDAAQRQARIADTPIELTSKEFDLLMFLANHVGKVCTHQMILSALWGPGSASEARYLHTYVHRLRQKLRERGVFIRTASGIGYVLLPTDAESSPPRSAVR